MVGGRWSAILNKRAGLADWARRRFAPAVVTNQLANTASSSRPAGGNRILCFLINLAKVSVSLPYPCGLFFALLLT